VPKVYPFEVRERFLDLLCGGLSVSAAAAEAGVSHGTGVSWWRQCGRMELRLVMGTRGGLAGEAPARCPGEGKRRRPLTSEDRAVIAAGLARTLSYAEIGALIGRNKSVVCREVARNRAANGTYHGGLAHRAAHERRKRPKQFKLVANPGLCRRIERWMDDGWSPRLIGQVLALDCAEKTERVSHETIYQALYVQTRGQLRADLHKQLSLARARRKPRSRREWKSTPYKEAFKIADRPPEADDRKVPGHWEGDLIMGSGNASAVGTLVERSTRFTILLHLPGRHDANSVAEAMIAEMGKLPGHLRRSISWDRGTEMADYADIQLALQTPVFFCDPHAPWQRGTNENTNRLLRFWLKKGTDLSIHTAADLRRVAATLNKRPRPTLDLQTPADRLNALLTKAA
jgi:transposase, IS30 family